MLPPPTAPNMDVTQEKLREVERRYAATPKTAGIGEAAIAGLQTAEALTGRYDKMEEKEKIKKQAADFQKVLDTGWAGYEEALAASTLDDQTKARLKPLKSGDPKVDAVSLPQRWKELSEAVDKAAGMAASTEYEALLADPNATPAQREAALAKVGKLTGNGYEVGKDIEAGRRTAEQKEADRKTSAENARVRAAATKAAAGIRRALSQAKDAGVVAAIERENERKADLEADLDVLEASDMAESKKRRERERLTREFSAIDSRISAYMTRVTDPSQIPETIRKPGAGAPPPETAARPRATNPKTGEIVEWDGSSWLPVKK